jgi:hypothetical protein
MKHFLIAGLLAAIGAVALVGPAHAASKYCFYHPDDPDCSSQGGQDGGGDYPPPSHHHNNGNGQYNPDDQYNQDDQGDQGYQGNQGYQGDQGYQDQGPGYQPVSRCEALGQGLRRYGYRHIRPLNCHGRFFGYEAFRGYHRFIVKVKANSGRIVSEIPR